MTLDFSLDALNFTLAGAREGFGPFLGVYLQSRGFDPARTGLAMSLAGIAGIVATAPLGALIDRIAVKRAALVAALVLIAAGAILIVASKTLWLVAAGQVFIGVADSSLAPLIAALTLGLIGPKRYPDRVARNEAFNHAGNALNATISAALGYVLGLGYVAAAIGIMSVTTSGVVLTIDADRIDHEAARGGRGDGESPWKALWRRKPLLLLGAAAFAFQAANGAMLPFMAQALTAQGRNPSLITGTMTVTAQLSMIGAASLVPRFAKYVDHTVILSGALLVVVARGVLASTSSSLGVVGVVQLLEGLSMGLAGVAIPALVASIMADSGNASAGLGGVLMAYGAGAAVSPALAGFIAQSFGFSAAFIVLGGVAAVGFGVWIMGLRALRWSGGNAISKPLNDRIVS